MSAETRRLVEIIRSVTNDVEAQKSHLNALDAALGDGDHGVSVTIGARAVRRSLEGTGQLSVGETVRRCGEILRGSAGATVGALLGAGLIRAGEQLSGRQAVSAADVAQAFRALADEVKRLGGAEVGDKTMLDALEPAATAASEAAAGGRSVVEVFERARDHARVGMESTDHLTARKGRASRLGQRTVGHRDPGATTVYLILDSIARHARGTELEPVPEPVSDEA